MIISDIHISGIEPHRELHLESLSEFNVLVGPNNSGKSVILEAISKLLFYKTSKVSDVGKKLYFKGNDVYSVTWTFNASIDEFFDGAEETMKVLENLTPELKEEVRKNGITGTYEYRIVGHSGDIQGKTFKGVFLGKRHLFADENYIGQIKPVDHIMNYFGRYYADYIGELTRPHNITNSMLISLVGTKRESVKHQLMQKMRDGDYGFKYDEFVKRFKNFLKEFPEVKHTAEGVYSIIGKNDDGSDIRIPFEQEGGGCLRAFQILNEIFLLEEGQTKTKTLGRIRPILIIDEPEISMHAKLQRKIFQELKKFAGKGQVFIATHSPIFISPGKNRTIILMPRVRTKEKIKYIQKPELNEISGSLGLRNRDYFLSNFVLLVEGSTEEEFLLRLLDESDIEPYDYGLWIRRLDGIETPRERFTQGIYDLLLNLGMEIILITDREGKYETTKKTIESTFSEQVKSKQLRWDLWSTNFEANFETVTLHETLSKCAQEYGVEFNISKNEFDKRLSDIGDEQHPNVLKKIYKEATGAGLKKSQFGRCLAEIVIAHKNAFKQNNVLLYFAEYLRRHDMQLLPDVEWVPEARYLVEDTHVVD
jgi:predicted ATPase